MNEQGKLLKNLGNDQSFIKKLYEQTTDDGIRKVFGEKNIPLSEQDLKELKALIVLSANNGGKLSDEIMENISGGGFANWISNNWHRMAYVACGVVATAAAIYEVDSLRKGIITTADKAVNNATKLLDDKGEKITNILDKARSDLAGKDLKGIVTAKASVF